jgi:7-cyano-7-deazaguanine tRNA-ribosyltransferase
MLDGFRKLGEKGGWLESLDTSSKSTLFYLSSESASRPEVVRYGSRIERLTLSGNVLITDDTKTKADGFDTVLHFKPPFGPYPAELAETYPFNAEVPVKADPSSMERALSNTKRMIDANPSARFSLRIKGLTREENDQVL